MGMLGGHLLLRVYLLLALCRSSSAAGMGLPADHPFARLTAEPSDLEAASADFGGVARARPAAVLHPSSAGDVAALVRAAYESAPGVRISARGHGHSTAGQALADDGVVVAMSREGGRVGIGRTPERLWYADVWGGELWIEVLRGALEHGLAPRSWTDYLYLSVGGTLSNGGISGQAFNHGPQISNVYELDVVTGKGELLTCSREQNSELFFGVLGGLGQFGIITRARIALESAPQWVRWIRVLYTNFSDFTKDQEYLISLHGKPAGERFDYVEGFVVLDDRLINNWRSSFSFSSVENPIKFSSIGSDGGVIYCLEMTINYDEPMNDAVNKKVEALLKKLHFISSSVFTRDVPYIDFLDRVHKAELKLQSKGLWEVPHPWLNLFVPRSQIADFDAGVFKGILGKKTNGPILIYPMNKNKWDANSSVLTPDEDVFYLVAFLWSAIDSGDETQTLEHLKHQNKQILDFCKRAGVKAKQYLPHYTTQEEWKSHFGDKWSRFLKRKLQFDPKFIMAPGQRIFQLPPPLPPSTSFE